MNITKKMCAAVLLFLLVMTLAVPVCAAPAEGDAAAASGSSDGLKAIAVGLAIGLAAAGGAVGMGIVGGKAADGKASIQVVGGDSLAAGQDNPVQVICTAENGEKKTYTVVVKRAAAHDGSVDEKPTTPTTEPTQTTTAAGEVPGSTEPSGNGGIPWWTLLIVGVVCLGGGFAAGYLFKNLLRHPHQ